MNLEKTALRLIMVLVGGMMLGASLLWLAFLIPTGRIYEHVRDSSRVFSIEGTYPVMDGTYAKMLDNWTDALMQEHAFFEKEGAGTLQRAMSVYRPEFEAGIPTKSLKSYVSGDRDFQAIPYPRYWHGYLVFLKPLLFVTDYLGIRGLNRVLQTLLVIFAAVVLSRRLSVKYIIPLTAAVLFMRPAAVAFSLQFSSIFYISILAVTATALFHGRLSLGNRYLYFFLSVGMLTNYIDFLTYPVAALGLPLAVWLCLESDKPLAGKIKRMAVYTGSWGLGYFGMWAGKWIIGSIVLKTNVLSDAMEQVRTRTSTAANSGTFSRWDAVLNNLYMGFGDHLAVVAAIIAAVCLAGLIRYRGNLKKFALQTIPFLIICLIPIIWFAVLSNHSYMHDYFTYRSLAVSVFSVFAMGAGYFSKNNRNN